MANDDSAAPRLITVEELAECLRFSSAHIYKMLHHGEIPFVKFGSGYFFDTAEINKWIADQEAKG